MLCGVDIDHAQGLAGHSDADVAVHALMDALLGAAGLGDIGELFPDTDPAFQDASSMRLLDKVMAWLTQNGWSVENADVTVICERPDWPATGSRCARIWPPRWASPATP